MRAIDFWNNVGVPCVYDFNQNPHTLKNIAIAVWAIDATLSHLYWEQNPDGTERDESLYKAKIMEDLPDLKFVLEASNCLKHAVRGRKTTLAAGSESITNRRRGWGEAKCGEDEFDGGPISLLEYRDGGSASLRHAIQEVVKCIKLNLLDHG